jgi:Domain of unknown function (DUF4402)
LLIASTSPLQAQTIGSLLSIEFGKLSASGAGTVVIPPTANTRTKTGSVSLAAGGTLRRGRIIVTGTGGATINISVPASVVVTGSNGGTATLATTVNGGLVQTLAAGGTRTIRFGGTLTFTGAVPAGTFSATVPVTVVY